MATWRAELLLVGCGAGFPEPAKDAFTKMIEAVEAGGIEAVIPIALRRIFTETYLEQHPDMAEERADVLAQDRFRRLHHCVPGFTRTRLPVLGPAGDEPDDDPRR